MKPNNWQYGVNSFLLVFVAIAGVLFGSLAAASTPDEEAQAVFDKADKQLNKLYQQMLRGITRGEARTNFVAAERAWIVYRDAEAELRTSLTVRGGIAYACTYLSIQTELTNERIHQLQKIKKEANPDYANFGD